LNLRELHSRAVQAIRKLRLRKIEDIKAGKLLHIHKLAEEQHEEQQKLKRELRLEGLYDKAHQKIIRIKPKSLEKTEVRLKEQKLDHYKEILRNKELDKIYDKAHERIRKAGKQEIERTEVKLEEPRLLIRKEKLETKEIERLEEKAHERS